MGVNNANIINLYEIIVKMVGNRCNKNLFLCAVNLKNVGDHGPLHLPHHGNF